jgi:hypothetical protein
MHTGASFMPTRVGGRARDIYHDIDMKLRETRQHQCILGGAADVMETASARTPQQKDCSRAPDCGTVAIRSVRMMAAAEIDHIFIDHLGGLHHQYFRA